MATAKKPVATGKTATTTPASKATTKAGAAPAAAKPAVNKPIKDELNKTQLLAHLAASSGVDIKAVRAVMSSLEATVHASINKKGAGSFTLPGIMKLTVVNVPAKKKRTGIDPFTKQERVFAAKPATVKIKARVLKKTKDAAL